MTTDGGSEGVHDALRRSERRYRSLVENLPGSVIILFDRELRFVLVDGPEVDASGASKPAMEGRRPHECLPPEFAEVVAGNMRRVLAGERFHMEIPWEDRMYHYEYVPLYDDDHHGVEHGLIVGQNVTRQHRADAALRASEQRFRAMFEAAPDAFVLHDLDARLLDGNHAAELLFGLDRNTVRGKSLFDVGTFAPESLPALVVAQAAIRERKPVGPTEVRFLRNDGKAIDLEMKAVPVQLDDQAVVLVAVRDVTDRVNAALARNHLEAQLHHAMKMEAVGRLAGGIAHDFNNVLTAIMSNVELAMLDLVDGAAAHEALTDAKIASARAASLVAQLLAFSRKQDIKPAVVDLDLVVAACTRLVTPLLGAQIKVVTVPARAPVWVRIDAGKLEQVLVNLAINARDAMPDGGELRFSLETLGTTAQLRVIDTGTGIPPDVIDRLFEPFFTTKPIGKGTGLGLSIAYGIVKQSDGEIRVRSQLGRGTTIEIDLPLAEPPAAATSPARDAPIGAGRVLVVEDDPHVARVIERCLRRHAYDVVCATGTDHALAYAHDPANAIDLLVTDIVMPELDGISLYERIATARPALPVLFISGYAEPSLLARVATHPRGSFLDKPFTVEDLVARVAEILARA